MRLRLQLATVDQAPEISALRLAVADHLAAKFGPGPWSRASTVKGVLYDLRHSVVYVATHRKKIIATLALCTVDPQAYSGHVVYSTTYLHETGRAIRTLDGRDFLRNWKPAIE